MPFSRPNDLRPQLNPVARLEVNPGQGSCSGFAFSVFGRISEERSGAPVCVIGETVRIPGFVVPLEFRDLKAVEFLLVPTAGACIHTPPPPANQIVHVRYPQGLEFEGLYAPVWVKGRMEAQRSVQGVRYVDGDASVETSYFMQPALVEPYLQQPLTAIESPSRTPSSTCGPTRRCRRARSWWSSRSRRRSSSVSRHLSSA